ncbi:nadp-specific glutamate dehydrogenase 1-related [Anaeramoeba ignava]|uniref:Glutamate dehydrogenase n=1 Tax=Anaeramoeba ignava TaxID=1746090 RepID=A0A9Q0LIB1_ANAIG|nr:nadp-specific glutamate dehydrogenase 1-related [Anaeramoeba ignava]
MNKKVLAIGATITAAAVGTFLYLKKRDAQKESDKEAENQIEDLLNQIKKKDPDQKEFHQAAEEILKTLTPVFKDDPRYFDALRCMVEPERVVMFQVPWYDDKGQLQVNRGYRVQFNSAIGPYKGGLRFHPTVNLSIIKFLGFEQILKNSLTTLPMGGGKGGSDFDPKGKSDNEVMHFCQSFMRELYRHVGPNCDVPAGDIGVGGREIGYLFGQYKKLRNAFEGVLTGKEMLKANEQDLKGMKCLVSGSGNVAQYCVEKLLHLGAIPLTMSDSNGFVYEPEGFDHEKLKIVMKIKNEDRQRISEYIKYSKSAQYYQGEKPWRIKCDAAFPCATQNEIDEIDARKLVANGCKIVAEGANMPSTISAINIYQKNDILYGPAKAANAGGVAVSGLEMCQNSERISWSSEEVDKMLKKIMTDIFRACAAAAKKYAQNPKDYMTGANIAGFLKVADAMISQGIVKPKEKEL